MSRCTSISLHARANRMELLCAYNGKSAKSDGMEARVHSERIYWRVRKSMMKFNFNFHFDFDSISEKLVCKRVRRDKSTFPIDRQPVLHTSSHYWLYGLLCLLHLCEWVLWLIWIRCFAFRYYVCLWNCERIQIAILLLVATMMMMMPKSCTSNAKFFSFFFAFLGTFPFDSMHALLRVVCACFHLFSLFILMLLLHVKQIAGNYDELMTFVCALYDCECLFLSCSVVWHRQQQQRHTRSICSAKNAKCNLSAMARRK